MPEQLKNEHSSFLYEKEKTINAINILEKIIEERNRIRLPGGDATIQKRERLTGEMSAYEKTFRKILQRLGYGDINFKKVGNNLFEIPIKHKLDYPDLSETYGFKGGQARAILLRELKIDPEASVRDVDIARLYNDDIAGTDDIIGEKYAPEDYRNGHGVEQLEKDYFESRDFTINEVLVANNKIYLTKECLLDTVRRIVRFSKFERRELWQSQEKWPNGFFVNDKLMAKAIRLAAAEAVRGKRLEIADQEVYEHLEINNFHIALHLDRALEQGWEVAMEYIRTMQDKGQISKNIEDPTKFLRMFIIKMEREDTFIFRHAPSGLFKNEEGFFNELDKFIAENVQTKNKLNYTNIAGQFEKSLDKE